MEKIRKFAKFRVISGWVFLFVVIIMAKPTLPFLVVGTVFFILGLFIRILAAGTLVKAEQLITGGIYKMTRNPLYLGSFFWGLGITIMSHQWVLIILYFVIFIPIYHYMISIEENFLRSAFGKEFEDYASSVPRLLPAPGAPPGLFINFSLAKYKANKEIGGNLASLAVAIILWMKYFLY